MIKGPTTYEVATAIHDAVWRRNDLLPEDVLANSNLHPQIGHMNKTEQVVALGHGDPNLPSYETLAKGKNGVFYLQATEGHRYTGRLPLSRCVITPTSGPEVAQRFASSMIIDAFMRLTEDS